MKKLIACGLMIFILAAPGMYAAPQTKETDKKALREQRREERRQKREERREERQQRKNEPGTPLPSTTANETNPAPEIIHEATDAPREPVIIPKQKAPEQKPALVENQTRSTPPKITQPSNQVASAPEATHPDTKSGKGNPVLWLLLIIGLFAFLILSWLFSRRCGNCGKFWAMRVIDEAYLGRVKTERVKDGSYTYLVHYNRIQVTRQCKYCGHQDRLIKTVKGDKE